MNKKELHEFKSILLRLRAQLSGEMGKLADEAPTLHFPSTFHMADVASDSFDKELNLDFIQIESADLRSIDEALTRMEQGTFGTCESCGKSISKTRLRAMPHARLCIECKREEEGQG
jgi:RNA polymerase-binding protein DksA